MNAEPRLEIRHATGSCRVYVESEWLEVIGAEMAATGVRWLVVTDRTVRDLYGDRFVSGVSEDRQPAWITLEPGESAKSPEVLASAWQQCLDAGLDRSSLVVALGGGVVGDLAGFVAATWMRGIPVIQVPTTLVAQVDSSIGGKTGINLAGAKNIVGAFWQPQAVFIDVELLASLPDDEYTSGLAEIVKYGMALDAGLLEILERQSAAICDREPSVLREIVERCCRLKGTIVEQDERETRGIRSVLNYGHTFGHAIESVFGYGTWLHGHAVAAGMHAAACLSRRLGMGDDGLVARHLRLFEDLRIPGHFPAARHDSLLEAMKNDKKAASGRPRFVLVDQPGRAFLSEPVERDLVLEAMRDASGGGER